MPTLKFRVTPKINDVNGDESDDDAEYCIRQEQTKMFQHAHVHSPVSGLKPLRDQWGIISRQAWHAEFR